MINEQLNRILASNLDQIDDHLLANEEKLGSLELFISAKTKELGSLQQCFMAELEEIKKYEEDRRKFQKFADCLRNELKCLKSILTALMQDHLSLARWKGDMECSILELTGILKATIRREETKRLEVIQEMNEEHLSTLNSLQNKHEEEVELLRRAIVYLQKELKKKTEATPKKPLPELATPQYRKPLGSQSNTKSQRDLNRGMVQPASPKLHINPSFNCGTPKRNIININQNIESSISRPVSPVAYRQSTVREQIFPPPRSSVSARKHVDEKQTSTKQEKERVQKRQSQVTSKHNMSSSYSITSNSNSFIRINDSKKGVPNDMLPVPQLPDLMINISYTPPIYNGFDVLIQKNKEVYKGMWKRGVFEGRGKLYSDTWIYDGEFKNGFIDGMGSLSFGGCTFIGKFTNNRANGEGTLYMRDRPITGLWKDHQFLRQV